MSVSPPDEDEEMLDYGEEEKIQTEPPKFDWSRRVLRTKNKHASKSKELKWLRKVEEKTNENINSVLMSVRCCTLIIVCF